MTRRTSPRRQIDDQAFPIRVRFRLPPTGLANLLGDAVRWLDAGAGRTECPQHAAQALDGDAMAVSAGPRTRALRRGVPATRDRAWHDCAGPHLADATHGASGRADHDRGTVRTTMTPVPPSSPSRLSGRCRRKLTAHKAPHRPSATTEIGLAAWARWRSRRGRPRGAWETWGSPTSSAHDSIRRVEAWPETA